MRQIYTSPRVENVERIVALLNEQGIETRVTNHRSWAGRDYKRSSYTSGGDSSEWPQVWIVKADDQPKARALLREAGIAPAVRFSEELARARAPRGDHARNALGMYIRLGLLGIIVILILLHAFSVF
jgi:hypothetical protein